MNDQRRGRPARRAPKRKAGLPALAALTLALGPAATSAPADWLVLTDGSRIETAGPWELRGALVVFRTAAGGSLASVRQRDVDLVASREVTQQAEDLATGRSRSADPEARDVSAHRVVTDADVLHVGNEEEGGQQAAEEDPDGEREADSARADAEPKARPATGTFLEVIGWRAVPSSDGQGVEIFGVLRNSGSVTVREVSLVVRLLGDDGTELADSPATLSARVLGPSGQSNFRVSFPGLPEAPGALFEADGVPVQ